MVTAQTTVAASPPIRPARRAQTLRHRRRGANGLLALACSPGWPAIFGEPFVVFESTRDHFSVDLVRERA